MVHLLGKPNTPPADRSRGNLQVVDMQQILFVLQFQQEKIQVLLEQWKRWTTTTQIINEGLTRKLCGLYRENKKLKKQIEWLRSQPGNTYPAEMPEFQE